MTTQGESPELHAWLSEKGLESFYHQLRKDGVEKSDDLAILTDADLKEMGDNLQMSIFVRRRFINAVESLHKPQKENCETGSNSIFIPMEPDERQSLDNLGNHIRKLESILESIAEASCELKTESNKWKEEIESKFNIILIEIEKQKQSTLDLIDLETEKALKVIVDGGRKSKDAADFCNSANDRCLKALQVKDISELSLRRDTILTIVGEALGKTFVQPMLDTPHEIEFLDIFKQIQGGDPLVSMKAPVILNAKEVGDFKYDAVFTTLGATGRTGPTELGDHYSGNDHEKHVEVLNGIQTWTVPMSGVYELEACGAQGGNARHMEQVEINGTHRDRHRGFWNGGKGARISAQFHLKGGDSIVVLIGQRGTAASFKRSPGSGGGGTFIMRNKCLLLVVSGGTGGYIGTADCTPSGRSFHGSGGEYKREHDISKNENYHGHGGSYANVDDIDEKYKSYPGMSFLDGGFGGYTEDKSMQQYTACGGFGGGGAGHSCGGAGGGYHGGIVMTQSSSIQEKYSATSFVHESGEVLDEADGFQSNDGFLHVKFVEYRRREWK